MADHHPRSIRHGRVRLLRPRSLIERSGHDIWRSFLTLTFDPKIYGELSREKAMYELKKYFIKVKRIFPDFTAIRVDEFQSNGRTHFHLLTNIELGSHLPIEFN